MKLAKINKISCLIDMCGNEEKEANLRDKGSRKF